MINLARECFLTMSQLSPVAVELNQSIKESSEATFNLLSSYGKRLFFPKGIVSQSQEAASKAKLFNATIGIAKENGKAMMFSGFEKYISPEIDPHKVLPYAPSAGILELRKLWADRQKKVNPSLNNSSLPMVVSGLTHGLSLAGDLFLDEGDTVVVPELFWGNYKLMWQLRCQANFVSFPFFDEKLTSFNLKAFRESLLGVKSSKIFLSLNFPQNPTGYSLTNEETSKLLQILKEVAELGKQIVCVCDDAYWGLVFEDGVRKESLFSDLANLHSNVLAVKIDGCTKEFFMWGFRVGFLTFGSKGMSQKAYSALENKASAALRGDISSVTHQSQEILRQLLLKEGLEERAKEKCELLRGRYCAVRDEVYKDEYSSLWDVYPFNSGYFMCLRLKQNLKGEDLRLHLLNQYGVGIISLGASNIRIAFSCVEKENIKALFEKIASAVRDLC